MLHAWVKSSCFIQSRFLVCSVALRKLWVFDYLLLFVFWLDLGVARLVSGIILQDSSSELASFWRCNLVLDLSKRLSQDLHKQK